MATGKVGIIEIMSGESPDEASLREYRALARNVWAACMAPAFYLACMMFVAWAFTGVSRYSATGFGFLGLSLLIATVGVGLRGVSKGK